MRKLNIRFARRNGRLEMLRGQNNKKRRKYVFEEVGHKEFEAKGWRGSRMIPKKCSFTICISVMFLISMQKTVRPQIRPGKKKLPLGQHLSI